MGALAAVGSRYSWRRHELAAIFSPPGKKQGVMNVGPPANARMLAGRVLAGRVLAVTSE
jgi:hypothetical protein